MDSPLPLLFFFGEMSRPLCSRWLLCLDLRWPSSRGNEGNLWQFEKWGLKNRGGGEQEEGVPKWTQLTSRFISRFYVQRRSLGVHQARPPGWDSFVTLGELQGVNQFQPSLEAPPGLTEGNSSFKAVTTQFNLRTRSQQANLQLSNLSK